MKLLFINHSKFKIPRKFITEKLSKVEKLLRQKGHKDYIKNKELVIVFVDKAQGQKLNFKYRKKNYATDVLSFTGMGPVLGELILCAQVIKKQAQEHKITQQEECLYVIIHGILHLLGYDHEKSLKDERIMFDLQNFISQKVLNLVVS